MYVQLRNYIFPGTHSFIEFVAMQSALSAFTIVMQCGLMH